MTINGESVVEIDIAGAGLTIAHAIAGTPLDPTIDPYAFDGLQRRVVKAFIVEKFGPRGLPFRWRQPITRDLGFPDIAALEMAAPAKQVWRKVRARYPLLKDPIDWAAIQFVESELIFGTIRQLAFEQGIPALPVHDSIIVPVSAERRAALTLSTISRELLGCSLRLVSAAIDPEAGSLVRRIVALPQELKATEFVALESDGAMATEGVAIRME